MTSDFPLCASIATTCGPFGLNVTCPSWLVAMVRVLVEIIDKIFEASGASGARLKLDAISKTANVPSVNVLVTSVGVWKLRTEHHRGRAVLENRWVRHEKVILIFDAESFCQIG